MQEEFLHYLWKFRHFVTQKLQTADEEELTILSPGLHNKNAGPDFENVKLRIGDTTWAGNVEIHLNSSDWDRHKHSTDPLYENVILHVVYQHNKDIFRNDGTKIPVLELRELIPFGLEQRYNELMSNLSWIACENRLGTLDPFHSKTWLSRVLIERLEEKSKAVQIILQEFKGSWDDAFYVILARNFGFKVNALPFEILARSLPQQIFARHKNNQQQIEALVFGQAGFLNDDFKEEYPEALKKEYAFLQVKHQLQPIDRHLWKFLRLRPQNFPIIRLAQFAALILKSHHLFSKVIECANAMEIRELFTDLPVNEYWKHHFRFGSSTKQVTTQLGDSSINNILINTASVFLFCYGKNFQKNSYVNKAIELLEILPAENNNIISRFKDAGIVAEGAFYSQALLQLKKDYCDKKRCLDCGIGIKLLNE